MNKVPVDGCAGFVTSWGGYFVLPLAVGSAKERGQKLTVAGSCDHEVKADALEIQALRLVNGRGKCGNDGVLFAVEAELVFAGRGIQEANAAGVLGHAFVRANEDSGGQWALF